MAKAYPIEWEANGEGFHAYVSEEGLTKNKSAYLSSMLRIIEQEDKYGDYLLSDMNFFDRFARIHLNQKEVIKFLELQAKMGESFALLLLARIKYVRREYQGCDTITKQIYKNNYHDWQVERLKAIFHRIRADSARKQGFLRSACDRYLKYIKTKYGDMGVGEGDKEKEEGLFSYVSDIEEIVGRREKFLDKFIEIKGKMESVQGADFTGEQATLTEIKDFAMKWQEQYQGSQRPENGGTTKILDDGLKDFKSKFEEAAKKIEELEKSIVSKLEAKRSEDEEKRRGSIPEFPSGAEPGEPEREGETKESATGEWPAPADATNKRFDGIITRIGDDCVHVILYNVNPYSQIYLRADTAMGQWFASDGFFNEDGRVNATAKSFFLYLFEKKYNESLEAGVGAYKNKDLHETSSQFSRAYGIFGLRHHAKNWRFELADPRRMIEDADEKLKGDVGCEEAAKTLDDSEKKAYCSIMIGLSVSIAENGHGGPGEGKNTVSVRRGEMAYRVSKAIQEQSQEVEALKKACKETAFFYAYPSDVREICARWVENKIGDLTESKQLWRFRLIVEGNVLEEPGKRLGLKELGKLPLVTHLWEDEKNEERKQKPTTPAEEAKKPSEQSPSELQKGQIVKEGDSEFIFEGSEEDE